MFWYNVEHVFYFHSCAKEGMVVIRRRGIRQDVLRFVASYIDENGYPPTYDEIREAVGLSSRSHVDYYLQALESDGAIRRTPRVASTKRASFPDGSDTSAIPAQGAKAAGGMNRCGPVSAGYESWSRPTRCCKRLPHRGG